MNSRVTAILEEFESLSEAEQRDLAAEILRRSSQWDNLPLTDNELAGLAEQQFLEFDIEEASKRPDSY
jgi:hypothetical protein